MRSALLATLALTATLTSAFAPSIADACGGYTPDPTPAVFVVRNHSVFVEGQRRAFVLLDAVATDADRAWSPVAPGTFDTTRISDVPDPKQSTTFTLVGPTGTRVVSSNRHVLLAMFNKRNGRSAIEVGVDKNSRFQIAVLGTQPTAKWIAVADSKQRSSTKAWLKAQGVEATTIYTSRVADTYLEVVSAYQDGQNGLTSFVRIGNRSLGQYTGTAIGALELGGKRYVLFESNGVVTPVAV